MTLALRVGALWIALVLLTAALHLAMRGWPVTLTASAIASWWVVAFLFGHSLAPRSTRTARNLFAVATAAALVLSIAGWWIGAGDAYWRRFPVANIAAVVLACELTALPVVSLGLRAGLWTHASWYRRWTVRAALGAAAVGAAWSGYAYLRDLGLVNYRSADRVVAFDRLMSTLESQYSHWRYSPIGPDELVKRWRPRIVAASRACTQDPCVPYLIELRDMLAELGDIHTGVMSRALPRPVPTAIATAVVDGELVVTAVNPGSDAERAGIRPGAIIRHVDGRNPEEAMAAVPAWTVAFSAKRTERTLRGEYVLDGAVGQAVAVEIDGIGSVVLARSPVAPRPEVTSRFVADGVLVISVRGLGDPSSVAAFDRSLDEPGVRALVVDLRGNGGGNSALGMAMLGRLLDHAVTYGSECFDHAHPLHQWLTGCSVLIAEPRGIGFGGRVAVLLDAGVISSGEWLAAAFCDTGRARCFGRVTAGGSGNPVQFGIPGGIVRYSTGNAVRLDGSPFERGGVPPHELVTWHRDDVLAGRDPDLEAALRWLR